MKTNIKLGASQSEDEDDEENSYAYQLLKMAEQLDLKAFANTVSMFFWGLVMAKAKIGFSAAFSKDKEAVSSSYKRFLQLVVLIGVASVVKISADYNYTENILFGDSQ